MIKDEILIYNEVASLKQKCFSCNMIGHDFTQCRKIRYIPFREFVISKAQFSKEHLKREDFNRGRAKKFNSRANYLTVNDKVQEYIYNASFLSDSMTYTEDGQHLDEDGNDLYDYSNTMRQIIPPIFGNNEDLGLHLNRSPPKQLTAGSRGKDNNNNNNNNHFIFENEEYEIDSDFSITNESSLKQNLKNIKENIHKTIVDLNSEKDFEKKKVFKRNSKTIDHENENKPSLEEKKHMLNSLHHGFTHSSTSRNENRRMSIKSSLHSGHQVNNGFGAPQKIYTFEQIGNLPGLKPENNHVEGRRKSKTNTSTMMMGLPHHGTIPSLLEMNENPDPFMKKETISKSLYRRKERMNTINTKAQMDRGNYSSYGVITSSGNVVNQKDKDDTRTATDTRLRGRNRAGGQQNNDEFLKGDNIFFLDFERVKSYNKYFVNNNMETIISKIKEKEKAQKKKKLKAMNSRRSIRIIGDASPSLRKKSKRGLGEGSHHSLSSKKDLFKLYDLDRGDELDELKKNLL